MRGTVKFFNAQKGWGFINHSEGKDIFVHHSNIIMDGFRYLNEGDIVDFDIGTGNNGRDQAVNVTPILTMKMVKNALKAKNLHIEIDPMVAYDDRKYVIVDRNDNRKYVVYNQNDVNDVFQPYEWGMSLVMLATYAGIDVKGLGISA